FGSIFMGAVNDFGALVVSLRNEGKSISECTAKLIGPRIRYIFFLIIFLELLIVIAIFGLVIAVIFAQFPQSVLPVWCEIPIAVLLGWIVYRRSGNVTVATIVAVIAMYATVVVGHFVPVTLPTVGGIPPTGLWTIILLIYAFIASTLPVTALLQPRDYINAWQLMIAMGLLVLGVVGAGLTQDLQIVAPAVNLTPEGAPPVWPFLFITIACGAVSGFHCLVSSGTSSKQLASETDAQFVGYGSMLMEAALATLVILAVGAGIGLAYETKDGTILQGAAAWQTHYASWSASSGLTAKLSAVVVGSANMMSAIGIPRDLGIVIIGVFVASFAGTTLDSATRIQRYVVSELFSDINVKFMAGRYPATLFAVLTAGALAFATGANGKGALTLWPMFGGVNQLLAALALLALTLYLKPKGGLKYLVTAIPCAFMMVMTVWAVLAKEIDFLRSGDWLLAAINGTTLVLAVWMVIECLVAFARGGPVPLAARPGSAEMGAS
ncbi:carbon starvation protein A, partial [bacterium]|nr:carbon starvation protein A [bacterium]